MYTKGMTHFSIKEAVVFGWHKVKTHSALVFGVVLTMFALEVASSVVQKSLEGTLLGAAASIVLAVAGVVLGAGMTLIFLKLAKGEHAEYRQILPDLKLVWKYFAASILSGLITVLPLAAGALVSLGFLSITGSINFSEGVPVAGHETQFAFALLIMLAALACSVYAGVRYSMSRLAVLDGSEIIESLGRSTKLTYGAKWHLVLFMLALIALNVLGLIALVVGLLITVPISLIAYSHIYLKLKARHSHH